MPTLRDLFTNEEDFHWSDVGSDDEVPHPSPAASTIDPETMGLGEIRVNDISTTFTLRKNYVPDITGGAVFAREKWNTPIGHVVP